MMALMSAIFILQPVIETKMLQMFWRLQLQIGVNEPADESIIVAQPLVTRGRNPKSFSLLSERQIKHHAQPRHGTHPEQ